jgi:uncharacterized protein
MTKDLWINLPVRDVAGSQKFFEKIGFSLNEAQSGPEMACFTIGEKNVTVLFFAEETFRGFTKSDVSDAKTGAEVLISLDAESRAEADELASRVFDAGGTIISEPQEIQGWMYGFVFADPDGHRWNVVHMDFAKMPPQ